MSSIQGVIMKCKQRAPYTEMSMEDMQAIFGGDPGKTGAPGGPTMGGPAPIFAKDDEAKACIIVDHGKLDEENMNAEGRGTTTYDASHADGLQVITNDGHTGGVYCTGEGSGCAGRRSARLSLLPRIQIAQARRLKCPLIWLFSLGFPPGLLFMRFFSLPGDPCLLSLFALLF